MTLLFISNIQCFFMHVLLRIYALNLTWEKKKLKFHFNFIWLKLLLIFKNGHFKRDMKDTMPPIYNDNKFLISPVWSKWLHINRKDILCLNGRCKKQASLRWPLLIKNTYILLFAKLHDLSLQRKSKLPFKIIRLDNERLKTR